MNYDSDSKIYAYLTVQQLSKRLCVSRSTIYAWKSQGLLPPLYRVGPRAVRFRLDEIEAFERSLLANDRKNAR